MDITKIDRLASVLFPGTNWTDKDSDNRVDTDELSPSANSSFLGRIGVSARIRNKHRPLIANIDKDGNGASLDEIEEHIISKEGLLCDIDPKKVLSALRKDGIYWTGNRKMIFIRQDKAQNAFELRQTNARVKALIAKFNVATVFSSKDSAPFGKETLNGSEKTVVILVSAKALEEKNETLTLIALKHEVLHAMQYFSGKHDEWTSVISYAKKSLELKQPEVKKVLEAENALLELEAVKVNLDLAIEKLDLANAKEVCNVIYVNLTILRDVRDRIEKSGNRDIVLLLDLFLEEAFPLAQRKAYAQKLKELWDDKISPYIAFE